MGTIKQIKASLTKLGYTVDYNKDKQLVIAQECQKETLHYENGDVNFKYPPTITPFDCDVIVNSEIEEVSEGYVWQCDVPGIFIMYED